MSLFCCAFYSEFQQMCRGVDTSYKLVFQFKKGVPCTELHGCFEKVWVLPCCSCPEDTYQLLRHREWMEQPQGQFDSIPKEESSGSVCSDECAWPVTTWQRCQDTDFIVNSALWSEGTKRPVPQLPRLSLQQSRPKCRFTELHTNFSELKTCFYFHVTSLKVFVLCGRPRGEVMGIPPKFYNWWLYPVDTGSLIYATL